MLLKEKCESLDLQRNIFIFVVTLEIFILWSPWYRESNISWSIYFSSGILLYLEDCNYIITRKDYRVSIKKVSTGKDFVIW